LQYNKQVHKGKGSATKAKLKH